eukprot:26181-Chlamydomonas_euryale.AAC.3
MRLPAVPPAIPARWNDSKKCGSAPADSGPDAVLIRSRLKWAEPKTSRHAATLSEMLRGGQVYVRVFLKKQMDGWMRVGRRGTRGMCWSGLGRGRRCPRRWTCGT